MFLIYSILYTIANLLFFLPQYFKRPTTLRKKWLHNKFGVFTHTGPSIWIHAVSVGEVNAALSLIKKLCREFPEKKIILSTITDTGQVLANERVPDGTDIIYLPFDLKWIIRRSIRQIPLKLFISIETEIWPNLLRTMSGSGIPTMILNGRISDGSAKGYGKVHFFMRKVLSHVDYFGMQSDIDAERIMSIGAASQKVSVTGNFKFDVNIPMEFPEWAATLSGPVIVAGSTHRGEEHLLIEVFREVILKVPDLKMIIAPRHPERFHEAGAIIESSGIAYSKRSSLGLPGQREMGKSDMLQAGISCPGILLLDSIGELSSVYGLADIVIIGKSFFAEGGQNPLEAAYWGKPILCGPHMENFAFIKTFYEEGAALETSDKLLANTIIELFENPGKLIEMGKKASALVKRNSGAVDKAVRAIGDYLV